MMHYPLFLARCSTEGSASQLLRFEPTHVGWVLTQQSRPVGLKDQLRSYFVSDLQAIYPRPNLQKGFTLLEMVLVLFLVGLMASATLMLTEGVEDQAKYDETKHRMEIMRKAIVGDPTRTVNGGPEISGFVADMGRLPLCVAELLELGTEKSPNTVPKTYDSPCDVNETIQIWDMDASTGIGSGWRGPYVAVLPERNGDIRFRDGYGNSDTSDAKNSGWSWQLYKADETLTADTSDATSIRIQSLGVDGSQPYPSGLISDALPANRPNPLVVSSDWQVQLPATVNINFKNQSGNALPLVTEDLLLRVYLSALTDAIEGDDGTNDYLVLDDNSVLAENTKTKNFTLNSSPNIAIGSRAFAVVCYEVPATGDPNDYVVFDGDCDSGNATPNTSNIRTFDVIPRQNVILNLDWIIP